MAKSLKSEIPLETFSKVVESIYDCALNPNRWIDTADMIGQLVGAEVCLLGVHDMKNVHHGVMFCPRGVEERYVRLYAEKYAAIDPHSVPLQLLPVGKVVTDGMIIDKQEVLHSRFYQEFMKPQGIFETIGFTVLRTKQRMGWLAAHRLKDQRRYGDAEVRLLTLLSPHVCRAITISDALNLKTITSEVLEVALNALTSGVYLADSLGRIIYTNRAAEEQIENGKVRIENSRLVPIDRMARARLVTVIDEAIADEAATISSGFSVPLPAREGGGLVAAVLPLHGGERRNLGGAFAARVAIFVQDPIVVPPFPGEAFAKLYGLTGSELRVLLAMAPGLSVKEAAEMLGIGETTAKTHIQHIYGKTSTSKQTELLHLFMSSTPPVKAA